MAVQLIIKSAAQNLEDFKIDCEMSWTIAQVKDHLATVYPTKPTREQQKLIYGGKLLPDHLPLKSILNPTQDLHVLHLVCPVPKKTEPVVSSSVNKAKSVTPDCTVPPLNNSGIYPQVLTNQQLPTVPNLTNVPNIPVGTFPLNTPADVVHQYLAMQQMYSQFMSQYFSQYNMAPPYAPFPSTTTTTSVQQPAAPVPPQQNNVNNNNNNPNAQAEDRFDFIDLLYIFSRATILIAVLVYYSSPPRIIAVLVLVLCLSLFAKMNKERQMRAANARQQAAANATAEDTQASENNTETTNESSATEQQTPTTPETTSIQRALSVPSTVMAIILSFFTSLFPSDPAPVNVN